MTYPIHGALLSTDGVYRWWLGREVDSTDPVDPWTDPCVAFVLLNPSTADALTDDPTVRRCRGFARALGYKRFAIVNLFALRATDPKTLRKHPSAMDGPMCGETSAWHHVFKTAGVVIVGWGALSTEWIRGQSIHARRQLVKLAREYRRPLQCLGTTKSGDPRHPLYLAASAHPRPWKSNVE